MFGLVLQQARTKRRQELRKAAHAELAVTGGPLALDVEELLHFAGPAEQAWVGLAVKRALAIRGLVQLGYTIHELATAWKATSEQVTAWQTVQLLDRSGIAEAIERQVLDELPETAEPGRVQPIDARLYPYSARAHARAAS